uniref:MerR family transcriptional regulator n=1 Tax=Desulfacinum infernum TaxID=35837 RepID=A0A831ZWM0_9BACT
MAASQTPSSMTTRTEMLALRGAGSDPRPRGEDRVEARKHHYGKKTVDTKNVIIYRAFMRREDLEKHKHCKELRAERLLEIVNGLVHEVAPAQPSSRIAETLSERTLRYYISKGLVDRPLAKEGTAALYGYRHILQLLALKRLQASYLPIKKIREIVPERSNAELEDIILGQDHEESSSMRAKALSYLATIARHESQQPKPFHGERMSLVFDEIPVVSCASEEPHNEAWQSWERIVLEDGIELHIRSDRRRTLSGRHLEGLGRKVMGLLKSLIP